MPKSKKDDPLNSILRSIDNTLTKQASMRRIFLQGLVRGLGTALGATILLTIVSSLGYQLLKYFDFTFITESFLNEVIED